MKYLIIVPDGAADEGIEALGGKSPLEAAGIENMNKLAQSGEVGLVQTIPEGVAPGSDAANLAVMGYDPRVYLTGRSPLEAVSIGIDMAPEDVAFRCNLVTLAGEGSYEAMTVIDHAAGDITTEEADELIAVINQAFETERLHFYTGVSYRHLMITNGGHTSYDLTPPHDILGQKTAAYLPKAAASEYAKGSKSIGDGAAGCAERENGADRTVIKCAKANSTGDAGAAYAKAGGAGDAGEEGADWIRKMMIESYHLLKEHPINKARIRKGLNPANSIWIWGQGKKPKLDSFYHKYKVKGAVVSAVDLIKGIGLCAGLKAIAVPGATGTLHTNFEAKAQAVFRCFEEGEDFVYLHLEAPDECSHQGDLEGKVKALELIDQKVVGPLRRLLTEKGEAFRLLIVPDHQTPLRIRTHAAGPVPYLLYDSRHTASYSDEKKFNETAAKKGPFFADAEALADAFFEKQTGR